MAQVLKNENKFPNVLIPPFFNNEIIKQFYKAHELPKQKLKKLQTYCEMIQSENTLEMYEGLVGLRIILDIKAKNGQAEGYLFALHELDILKYLMQIIEHNEFQLIIYEALLVLINSTNWSSQVVDQIIENGFINCFVLKFSSGNYHDLIIELICQIIHNVTKQSLESTDLMIKLGVLKILNNFAIDKTNEFENLNLIQTLIWSIQFFFMSVSQLPLKDLQVSLKCFSIWILKDLSLQTHLDICLAIYLSMQCQFNSIQIIIDLGIVPTLMQLVEANDKKLFEINFIILTHILQSQHHQEYLCSIGIISCLGSLVKKYTKCEWEIIQVLEAFEVISNSKYLSYFLLQSDELDLLLSLFNLKETTISGKIQVIMINLIKQHQKFESINLIQNNKIIMFFQIFATSDQIPQLSQKIIDLSDAYLVDERFSIFHEELKELKSQIIQKLQ